MTEEREHLQRLIDLHRANLQHYEELEAKYGLDCPVYVKNAKEEARKGLAEARAKLAALEGGAPGAEPSIPSIPQNLPPRGEFIGREREMEQVRQALASRSYLVVVEGIGGIGKTALALEVAHELWETGLYDGVIWTTARDRVLDLNDILDTFARTIDYPYIAQLPPEEKPAEAAKLMRAKKCLLLVDNFETIKDEAVPGFLLNLPEPSKALITTRHHALGEARTIPLKGMEQGEALMLLQLEGERRSVEAIAQAEEKTLLRLYEATGGAPLALKWAVGQLKFGQTLDTVLDGLYKAKGRIFEHMFGRSWDLLTEHARRILMVMPIFATSASKEAIKAASDVHTWELDEGLGQLVEMSLVEVSGGVEEQQRYSVHPLVRAFAGTKLNTSSQLKKQARLRLVSHFLKRAAEYHSMEQREKLHEIEPDLPNMLAIVDQCYKVEGWENVSRLGEAIEALLGFRDWNARIDVALKQTYALKELGDKRNRARCAVWTLGWMYYRQGALETAQEWYETGMRLWKELEDRWWIARVEQLLALVVRERGRNEEADRLLEASSHVFEQFNVEDVPVADMLKCWNIAPVPESKEYAAAQVFRQIAIADILRSRGGIAFRRQELERARKFYEESASMLREVEEFNIRELQVPILDGIAHSYHHLGRVLLKQGEWDEAQRLLEVSLAAAQRLRDSSFEAIAQQYLSELHEAKGNYQQALELANKALEMYEHLGMRKELQEIYELIERLEGAVAKQESATDREN
jgi:tetratricopeptide (TPR) repeat protein